MHLRVVLICSLVQVVRMLHALVIHTVTLYRLQSRRYCCVTDGKDMNNLFSGNDIAGNADLIALKALMPGAGTASRCGNALPHCRFCAR